jgi:hypothetical protein
LRASSVTRAASCRKPAALRVYADAAIGFRGDFERLRAVYAALLGATGKRDHSAP